MATRCLNCGETVAGKFCPACGQPVEDRRRPLFGLVGEFSPRVGRRAHDDDETAGHCLTIHVAALVPGIAGAVAIPGHDDEIVESVAIHVSGRDRDNAVAHVGTEDVGCAWRRDGKIGVAKVDGAVQHHHL